MPHRAIYRNPENNAHHKFPDSTVKGEWFVKTKRGLEPLTDPLSNGFRFVVHERYGEEVVGEPVPPRPVPNPLTLPADFDAYINEKRYENWSITTAYWFAKNPAHSSADLEMQCQSDSGFRMALDASAGIEHLIPAPPAEMRTTTKEEQRYKTLSQLTSSQTDYINRKTRVGGWAAEKSYSLIVDRNGVWKDTGEFAVFGGHVVAECRECHRKAKYPLSGWVDGQCRCSCGAHEHYSQAGTKIEGGF